MQPERRDGFQATQQRLGDTRGAQASPHSGEAKAKAPADAKVDYSHGFQVFPALTVCHLQHSAGHWALVIQTTQPHA